MGLLGIRSHFSRTSIKTIMDVVLLKMKLAKTVPVIFYKYLLPIATLKTNSRVPLTCVTRVANLRFDEHDYDCWPQLACITAVFDCVLSAEHFRSTVFFFFFFLKAWTGTNFLIR